MLDFQSSNIKMLPLSNFPEKLTSKHPKIKIIPRFFLPDLKIIHTCIIVQTQDVANFQSGKVKKKIKANIIMKLAIYSMKRK